MFNYSPLINWEVFTAQCEYAPLQYLRQHEHVVLDPAFSPSEPSEIFHSEDHGQQQQQQPHPMKRRPSDSFYESEECAVPAAKRACGVPGGGQGPLALFSPPPHLTPATPDGFSTPGSASSGPGSVAGGDDEWRNIHVMLNCILSMVEKTKRALAILQHRGAVPGVVTDDWGRGDIKRTAADIMAQTIRTTEERVAEVKRRAEEAVNEVKRQAVAELQRAVAQAEAKAAELVAAERAKVEKVLAEARRQAVPTDDDEPPPAGVTAATANACWNCGRRANETCSGCNTARYCGAFCQHKDWDSHHQVCCKLPPPVPLSVPAAPSQQPTSSPAVPPTVTGVSPSGATPAK
ncbi:protein CBFA2T3-like [Schistocerca nitens]|uniref:protein CBFA2T3-like n=1 Tax=Schistocerca nitens TaxID=7011 RepID=UPI00211826AC|nr:protein CBFA2T3-like [Schistocerca nitens]